MVSIVGAVSANDGIAANTADPAVVAWPSGHASGDRAYLAAFHTVSGSSVSTFDALSGWTSLGVMTESAGSDRYGELFTRVATSGAESSASITTAVASRKSGSMIVVRGQHSVDHLDVVNVLIHDQGEEHYVASFSGGASGHSVSDVITIDGGALITVIAVSAGVVTEFSVNAGPDAGGHSATDVLNMVSSTGGGDAFSLTLAASNISYFPVAVANNNTTKANPGVKTVTDNCALILFDYLTAATPPSSIGAPTTPSGLTFASEGAGSLAGVAYDTIALAYKADVGAAGLITPSVWTHDNTDPNLEKVQFTLAIRPAGSSSNNLSMGGIIVLP